MKTFIALVKREILNGKNAYVYTPLVLAGISLLLFILATIGFGNSIYLDELKNLNIQSNGSVVIVVESHENSSEVLKETTVKTRPATFVVASWMMSSLPWFSFPFVLFFSLLGALYEERRDRSVLFWKSMPVSDTQEVLAKFFTPVVVTPVVFLGVVIVLQLIMGVVLSGLALFQEGLIARDFWPISMMINSWIMALLFYLFWALWALPVLAWVLFVSSFATRLPFLWAVLPPIVIIAIEQMLFDSQNFRNWVSTHLGNWNVDIATGYSINIEHPSEIFAVVGDILWYGATASLANGQFWLGLIIAGGLLFGAIRLRQRAL